MVAAARPVSPASNAENVYRRISHTRNAYHFRKVKPRGDEKRNGANEPLSERICVECNSFVRSKSYNDLPRQMPSPLGEIRKIR